MILLTARHQKKREESYEVICNFCTKKDTCPVEVKDKAMCFDFEYEGRSSKELQEEM